MDRDVVSILNKIAVAGANADGSYTREPFSKEYFQAVDTVNGFMEELGMTVTVDAAGNAHGILPGLNPALKHIIMGSHLDTVEQGGKYDGAYGVAGALAVLFQLKEAKVQLNHTVEIYGFNGEERSTIGSKAVAGLIDKDDNYFAAQIKGYGHTVDEMLPCKRDFSDAKCFLELHIEQGERLDKEKLNIGIVSGIVAAARYKVVALGKSNHAGTTQMFRRHDALVGMCKLILKGNELCRALDPDMVFTVGTISCEPGAKNVIPGRVECCFGMRQLDKTKMAALIEAIKEEAEKISDCKFIIEPESFIPAAMCDKQIVADLETVTKTAQLSSVVMPSGAWHDCNSFANLCPIGMIFVPSRDGLSHCKEEWTGDNDLQNGVKVLKGLVEKLDKED